jgi:hypothetical protein
MVKELRRKRACLFPNWLKMVFIRLSWFGDGQGPASVVEFFGASALPELKKP